MQRTSDLITKELRDACVTYRKAVEVYGPISNGKYFAVLECGHQTPGSTVNKPTVGSAQFCVMCTSAKLDKIGE